MSKLSVGDRVIAGEGEDEDTGRILSIDETTKMAEVAWDSHVRTPAPLEDLRPTDPPTLRGGGGEGGVMSVNDRPVGEPVGEPVGAPVGEQVEDQVRDRR